MIKTNEFRLIDANALLDDLKELLNQEVLICWSGWWWRWSGGQCGKGGNEMTDFEMRMEDLERRLQALEDRTRRFVWSREEERTRREKELVDRYGEHVDKSTAARILGMTRQTVYAMLADGRIEGACEGKRVDVRSIARYIYAGEPKDRRSKHAADALEEA